MKTFAADRQPGDFIRPQGSSALKYYLALFRKFVSAVVNALVYDYRKLSRFAEVAAVPGFLDLCLCPVSALLTTFGTQTFCQLEMEANLHKGETSATLRRLNGAPPM